MVQHEREARITSEEAVNGIAQLQQWDQMPRFDQDTGYAIISRPDANGDYRVGRLPSAAVQALERSFRGPPAYSAWTCRNINAAETTYNISRRQAEEASVFLAICEGRAHSAEDTGFVTICLPDGSEDTTHGLSAREVYSLEEYFNRR
ncbi:uncharacterized protein I303_103469 [Kwoniella dejecticola CBS 10117]|uniref:Uncharacterized protein n=1 Tax=Kwoniella dejecticola CBS 10117 TaxID=1296121 RepID=A0AAJ8MGX5_9TREE